MESTRTNSHNVFITTFGNILPLLAALITAPVLARSLDVSGRGELAATTAPLILAAAGLTLGAPEAVTYFVARGQARFWRSFLFALALVIPAGLVGMLIIFLCSDTLAKNDSDIAYLIVLASIAVLPSLATLCIRGYARGRQAWTLIALDQAIGSLFRVSGIGLLAIFGQLTVPTATAVTAIGVFVGVLAYLPLCYRRKDMPPERTEDRTHFGAFAKYGAAVWLGTAAGILLTKLDLLLVLPLSNAYVLGIYVVAVNLADIVRVLIMSVRDVVFAAQASLAEDEPLARACRLSNGLAFVAGLLVSAMSVPLIPILFGSNFSDSVPVLIVLIIGVVVGSPGSVMAAGLTARGRPLLRSVATFCGLLVDLLFLVILVPVLGALGAAIASALAYGVSGCVVLLLGRKSFGLRIRSHLIPTRSDLRYLRNALSRLPLIGRAFNGIR